MKIVIGLGNPGDQYKNTWHNAGFMTVDQLQKNWEFESFKNDKKLKAEISIGKLSARGAAPASGTGSAHRGEKIILAKPQTFMNESGLAAALLKNYFKAKNAEIIVIHDDVDLPLEKLRIVKDSSAGGHNGVKSIIESLGTQEFIRLKIGVKTAQTAKIGTLKFVLEKIGQTEKLKINETIKKAAHAATAIIEDALESAMNKFN